MTTRAFKDRLTRRARRAGVALAPEVVSALEQYLRLLSRWNEKINLTAFQLREPVDEAIDRLLIEPLLAARHVTPGATAFLDVGSGSGSPALPFRIARPELRGVLVESKTRKAVFLLEAIRHLGLGNVSVETARFEELLTRPDFHEAFDIVTLRAVRVEARTLHTLQAFLRPGGQVFWFRGPSGHEPAPEHILPLIASAAHPLVESLRSRLFVLTKQAAGIMARRA